MGGGQDDSAEKYHDPTPHKIEQARKKGDIAKSADISVAAAYLGLLVAILAVGSDAIIAFSETLVVFLAAPDRLVPQILGSGGIGISAGMFITATSAILPLFLIPLIAVLLSIIGQRAFVVAPDKLIPKLSRISPISGAKNKFGVSGMVEFAKTFVKMLAVGLVVGIYLNSHFDEIIGLGRSSPVTLTGELFAVLVDLLMMITMLAIGIGVIDMLWQKYNHLQKLRMSFQELRDENKESEGDPHTKSQRRQRGRDIATNRMLLDVPKADVIVVNPTHYAVALQWARTSGSAPKCIAKGEDEIAARIRETAQIAGVPIHSDPPTTRSIYATVKIGEEIAPEHYKPIAAALRFAEEMRKKAKARGMV